MSDSCPKSPRTRTGQMSMNDFRYLAENVRRCPENVRKLANRLCPDSPDMSGHLSQPAETLTSAPGGPPASHERENDMDITQLALALRRLARETSLSLADLDKLDKKTRLKIEVALEKDGPIVDIEAAWRSRDRARRQSVAGVPLSLSKKTPASAEKSMITVWP